MTETRYQRTKRRRERRDRIREYAMSVRQRDANGSMIAALQTYLCPLCDLVELLDLAAKIEATIADELGHIVRPKPRSRVMVG